jgi:hypothetical protein
MRKVKDVQLVDDVQEAIHLAHALDAAVRGLHPEDEAREGIARIFEFHFEQLDQIMKRVEQ